MLDEDPGTTSTGHDSLSSDATLKTNDTRDYVVTTARTNFELEQPEGSQN